MSIRTLLLAGAATLAMLSSSPSAYADANDETRELNLRQLDHPGAGARAVPGHEEDEYDDDDDYDHGAADDDDDGDDDFGATSDDDDDDFSPGDDEDDD